MTSSHLPSLSRGVWVMEQGNEGRREGQMLSPNLCPSNSTHCSSNKGPQGTPDLCGRHLPGPALS